MYICVCEREAESNSMELVLYLSAEDIHSAGTSPGSLATLGQNSESG